MKIGRPDCASHTYRQKLKAPPEKIFHLLCPVREAERASDWDPDLVLSAWGVKSARKLVAAFSRFC